MSRNLQHLVQKFQLICFGGRSIIGEETVSCPVTALPLLFWHIIFIELLHIDYWVLISAYILFSS